MNVAVAVSGGVDSLYALTRLQDEGHAVMALHARFTDGPSDPAPRLAACCAELGIPLHVEDLRREFRKEIIQPFIRAHALSLTPNPCANCNRIMKFGRLLDSAEKFGAEKLATGHYACLEGQPSYGAGAFLRSIPGNPKDQSYFLSLVPVSRLQRVLFPLAGMHKETIRAKISEKGLKVPIPDESQDICFVPGNDYRAFLQENTKGKSVGACGEGPVILWDTGTVIARHAGLWRYTEGQRKGLGIPWREPLYVMRRDAAANTLYVATKRFVMTETADALAVNFLVPPRLWPEKLFVRTRFRQKPVPAAVIVNAATSKGTPSDGSMEKTVSAENAAASLSVRFASPQEPHAPGQILAVYDAEGFILAGGILTA